MVHTYTTIHYASIKDLTFHPKGDSSPIFGEDISECCAFLFAQSQFHHDIL
jgi:hypothetical protein